MLPYWNLGGTLFPTYSLLTLLGAAAAWLYFHRQLKARGENPGRTEQAFLFGVLGALVGAKFLYLLPQLPQLLRTSPCWRPIRPPFPPATSRVGSSLWRAVRRSGRGLAVLPAAQVPFPGTGPTAWSPPSPCSTPLAGWAASWPGAATHSRPRRLAGGDLSGLSVAPNGVALLPVQLYEAAGCLASLFFCCTAWPAGLEEEPFAFWSIWHLRPVPLRPGIFFFRAMRPRRCGVFSTSQPAGSVQIYSGRCPPPS